MLKSFMNLVFNSIYTNNETLNLLKFILYLNKINSHDPNRIQNRIT